MNKTTINECFKTFLLEKRVKGLSQKTLDNYEATYYLFLRDNKLIEDDEVTAISKDVIIRWTNQMQHTDLSPESINAYLGQLRVFVNWLCENEYIPKIKINMMKHQEEKIKFFNDEEIELLLKKPSKNASFIEWRTYTIICFILSTGARASTVCNIKMEDIHSDEVVFKHSKNKKLMVIPLSSGIQNAIGEYLRIWDIDSEYLFCDSYSQQLTVSALRQALKKYCIKRGVNPRGPHSLRHSFSRCFIRNGGSPFYLQQILGHSSLEMTKRYVRLFSEDLKNEIIYNPLDSYVKTHKKIKRA